MIARSPNVIHPPGGYGRDDAAAVSHGDPARAKLPPTHIITLRNKCITLSTLILGIQEQVHPVRR